MSGAEITKKLFWAHFSKVSLFLRFGVPKRNNHHFGPKMRKSAEFPFFAFWRSGRTHSHTEDRILSRFPLLAPLERSPWEGLRSPPLQLPARPFLGPSAAACNLFHCLTQSNCPITRIRNTRGNTNVVCIHKCAHMHRKHYRMRTERCTGLAGHTKTPRKVFVVPLPHDVRCKGSIDPNLIQIPLTQS